MAEKKSCVNQRGEKCCMSMSGAFKSYGCPCGVVFFCDIGYLINTVVHFRWPLGH